MPALHRKQHAIQGLGVVFKQKWPEATYRKTLSVTRKADYRRDINITSWAAQFVVILTNRLQCPQVTCTFVVDKEGQEFRTTILPLFTNFYECNASK